MIARRLRAATIAAKELVTTRGWPKRHPSRWTDVELDAALDETAPGFTQAVQRMSDEELDEALRDLGVL